MENSRNDLVSLLYKMKSCGVRFPVGMYSDVDSLKSALVKFKPVADKQKFVDTARKVHRVLDLALTNCLNNGYIQAAVCGDQHMATICLKQLLEYSSMKNKAGSLISGDRTSIAQPYSGPLKKFPYVESLLNCSDIEPPKSNALVNNLDDLDKTISKRWPYVTKLLNETNKKVDMNINKSGLDTAQKNEKSKNPADESNVRPNIHNQNYIKDSNSNGSLQPFKIVRNNSSGTKKANVVNNLTNNEVNSEVTDVGKPTLSNGVSVLKKHNQSRVNAKTVGKKYTPILARSSERLAKFKSKNNTRSNDSDEVVDKVKPKRRSKGTPGILKQNTLNKSEKNNKKKVIVRTVSTPVKRFATPKLRKGKRKHESICSSELNSTLRPRVKRFRASTTSLIHENKKLSTKKSKGTVESKNSSNYSAITEMSSTYNETPKSTMTNRVDKVRVFNRRNLFSTPRGKAKKKWLN